MSLTWSACLCFSLGLHWILPKARRAVGAREHSKVCMYVCMSENVYPARLKQKSQSRRSLKQKRLQCPFEPFSGQVG